MVCDQQFTGDSCTAQAEGEELTQEDSTQNISGEREGGREVGRERGRELYARNAIKQNSMHSSHSHTIHYVLCRATSYPPRWSSVAARSLASKTRPSEVPVGPASWTCCGVLRVCCRVAYNMTLVSNWLHVSQRANTIHYSTSSVNYSNW